MEDIDFSVSKIVTSFVFGVIGLYVFAYGKRQVDYQFLFIGIALMIYPYLTRGIWADWGVGLGLCAYAYWLRMRS